MTLMKSVPQDKRTQWWIYPDEIKFKTQFLLNVGVLSVTQDMIDVMLGERNWSGFRYANDDGDMKIGYGHGNPDLAQGMTEVQSYGEFVEFVRNREKLFIKQIPLIEMPRSAFDALFSLYMDTGKWRTVNSNDGEYDIRHAAVSGDWKMCADMLMRASTNRSMRKAEARAMALGQYAKKHSREEMRSLGLQNMRRMHVENLFNGSFEKRQAEYVYYRETSNFFPSTTDAQRRKIVKSAI